MNLWSEIITGRSPCSLIVMGEASSGLDRAAGNERDVQ